MAKKADPHHVIDQWLERDLTQAAAAGQLAPAFEVDDVLDQVSELLASGRNPILIGEPGVGKTAVIYEMVRRVTAGSGPLSLGGKRVLQMSLQRRASGLKDTSQMRPEMDKLADALPRVGDDIVPFFRDIHLAYQFDLEPQLQSLPYRLASPMLGEGHRSTVETMFENTPELEQHYVLVEVPEPGLEQVERILQAWSADQASRHNKRFSPPALAEALYLSHRFLARTRLPRKVLDLLKQVGSLTGGDRPVTDSDVIDRFCASHHVPRVLVDPAVALDLAELEATFSSRVLGQPEAVKAVVHMIGLIKAGLSDMRRPFGVFLFVGPTGVGKTHVAQLLAEYLFGSRDRMVRINMGDFKDKWAAFTLFGNPDADRLPQIRGLLTQRIMGHPFAVLLLDEFEKADQNVHDRFLQLVDEGCFINGAAESISCRSMIVIAASNAGAEVYRGQTFGFGSLGDVAAKDGELDRRLEQHFRFEFLNRFDRVVHFHPLSREDIRAIALRELEALKHRAGFKQRRLALEVDEPVLDWLTAHGYDPDYGARFLRRTIERNVTTALADAIVRENPAGGTRIVLTVRGNRVVACVPGPGAVAGPRKELVTLPVGTTEQVRMLDAERLAHEVAAVLSAAAPRLTALERKREERSTLLAKMNEAGFWDHLVDRRDVLDRFRELDVAIQVESRLARAILRLTELDESRTGGPEQHRRLARSLEAAARALHEWQERLDETGPSSVWVLLSNADPLRPAGQWLADLAKMELAWCRKLGLSATVVAYELADDELTRVAVDVEGPGTSAYLAMEAGIHRLARNQGAALRARLEIIPKGPCATQAWPRLRTIRYRQGLFDVEPDCRARLELKARGLGVEFLGKRGEALFHLLGDLERAWNRVPTEQPQVARTYGEDGSGARDPRTGVVVPGLRDVLRGRLDRFLEGWRRRAG